MIIGGGSRRGAKWFAGHLMRTDGGQLVRLAEARGLAGYDIPGWFRQMEAVSFGTRCDNFFYHANINPREDESLTEAQWQEATDRLEQNLGLDGHARFVVEHEKQGRVHRHVFWSRIDPETMTAVSDSKTYRIHEKTADELEKAFGHEPTPRGRGPEGRNPDNWEVFRGQQSQIDPYDIKAELTELWQQADTGKAFAAALEDHGYILAKGDRRDFVVVDAAGDDHSLARRIGGVRAADVRARMKDIDRDALPSVEEARALARERPDREDGEPVSIPPDAPIIEPQHGAEASPAEATAFDRMAADLLTSTQYEPPEKKSQERRRPESPSREGEPAYGWNPDEDLSAFDRTASQWMRAYREAAGDGLFIAEGIDWLAGKIKHLFSGTRRAEEPTAFERAADEMTEATRANGGEPCTADGQSFWQRSVALFASARERLASFVRSSWQELTQRFSRDAERDEQGLER